MSSRRHDSGLAQSHTGWLSHGFSGSQQWPGLCSPGLGGTLPPFGYGQGEGGGKRALRASLGKGEKSQRILGSRPAKGTELHSDATQ